MQATSVEVTRAELYEMVWSEPMITLARRLGLSDVGLAKACKRLRVPVPYRGYWRQKEVGQAVKRTPLPKLSDWAQAQLPKVVLRPPGDAGEEEVEETGPIAEQERTGGDASDPEQIRPNASAADGARKKRGS